MLGGEFSKLLAKECNFETKFPSESPTNLQRVSLCYEFDRPAHDRTALIARVKEAVQQDKKPSPILRALAELNFPLVITTNYDQLFEDALRTAPIPKRPHVHWYQKDRSKVTGNFPEASAAEPFIFKLHGDIDTSDSIVITDEDYIHFVLRMRDSMPHFPVPLAFLHNFMASTTLFLGYSLLDYNLRLLFKTLFWTLDEANRPPLYAVDPKPDALIERVWSDRNGYVRFIVQDVWAFVPRLYEEITGKSMPDGDR